MKATPIISHVLGWVNEKRAYIFFSEQRKCYQKVRHPLCIHCFLYHKAQLQYWSVVTAPSFAPPPPPPQYRNDVNKLGQVRWRVTESVTGALWEGLVQPGEETILEYLRATPVPMRSVLQWQSQASVGASWWNAWETKGICWNKKDAEWLQGKAFCLPTVEQATKDFESLITTPRSKLSSLYFCSFISELCSLVGNVYFWIFLDRASTIHEQLPIDFKSALLRSEIYCDGYTSTLHVTDMSYTYIYLSHTYT